MTNPELLWIEDLLGRNDTVCAQHKPQAITWFEFRLERFGLQLEEAEGIGWVPF